MYKQEFFMLSTKHMFMFNMFFIILQENRMNQENMIVVTSYRLYMFILCKTSCYIFLKSV